MIKSKITMAIVAALALSYGSAYAQTAPSDGSQQSDQKAPSTKDVTKLQAVTVTGSLIPQTAIETATPIITITADQMKARGFSTVAEALQQSSFATGTVQGAQDTNSFTPGAKTLSMFGLPVGFVKYLIDGRPMGSFPSLYNGSNTFNSLGGIPMDMVDHIDILPGGQSSLYGSDAIAGVINIVLKKHIDAPTVDVRYGWYKNGGGADTRISFADSFNVGKFNSMVGVQWENTQPIWRKDRSLTRQYYTQGASVPVASRDYLVLSAYANDRAYKNGYHMLDPNNCANLTDQWGGTEGPQHRKNSGDYCGSFYTPGAGTLANGSKTANLYTHNTFDVSDNLQLYGDLLYNYSETKYINGANTTWWGSSVDTAKAGGGYFWDPTQGGGALMLVQHAFSPEEVGGYQNIMSTDTENSYMLTFGARGTFGQSNWDYDLGFTHSDDKMNSRDLQRVAGPMEQYFSDHVMGQQQGTYSGYPVFEPNYANLYHPVTPADFRSFTAYSNTYGKTWDNMLRGQLTNASLFHLPGGDAGLAVVVEGGNQGMDISPDPRLMATTTIFNGQTVPYFWGTSATPAAGHRSRYAATTELKLPVLSQVTLDLSGRYDSYKVGSATVSHKTYNLGLEYRPFESLLLRGRYGNAFKVPTLSDEFQRPSGAYGFVYDYLNCQRQGYTGATASQCGTPYNSEQYHQITEGNPALKPITAKVWSYGFVWAPMANMSLGVDYLHWSINNEVGQLSATLLSQTQAQCDIGTLDPNSGLCKQAFDLVTRGPGITKNGIPLLGVITDVHKPKLNVANESVNAIQANFGYIQDIGRFGRLSFTATYSDIFKHTFQSTPLDTPLDLLTNPGQSTDFKSKGNASLTWMVSKWSTTLFVNRYGATPNYAAQVANSYTKPNTGKVGAWVLWNGSVTYNPIKDLALSVQVSNLFNKMPPVDHTMPGTTYMPYNQDNYNVYGRQIFVEARYKFGNGG